MSAPENPGPELSGKPLEALCLGIAGLGLMGGAAAMALRRAFGGRRGRILACDTGRGVLDSALGKGVIDEGFDSPEQMLPRCDLVFLCLNPSTLLRFLEKWMGAFKQGALITDMAGIKGSIVEAVEKGLREDLDFIPGHPMAGAEGGGFANAEKCSFLGKNYILTPLKRNRPENLEFLKSLIRRMGFGRITETTAAEHDRKIAFTSQLCHVIAAALIDCEGDREITRFGGGSFEDLTRIAMLNAPMWTELFIENKECLLERIDQFEGSLEALKKLIRAGAAEELRERLGRVRDRRAAMA
ncbi:MAG: prephenate dehydrogenase [Treponema sp.]|jgi:prephenate dehydrogenase|nr:prephenate dehydrogenase [Treponema sp.]